MADLKVRSLQADERVSVFATRDLKNEAGKVTVGKGSRQDVFRVDAREMCQTPDWTMTVPGSRLSAPQVSSEESFKLTDVPGISRNIADLFISNGYGSLEPLREATVQDLTSIRGIGTNYARSVVLYLADHFGGVGLDDDDDDDVERAEG